MSRPRGHFRTTITLPVELIEDADRFADCYRLPLNTVIGILVHNDIEQPRKLVSPIHEPSRFAYPKHPVSLPPELKDLISARLRKTRLNFSNYVAALLVEAMAMRGKPLLIVRRTDGL